MNRIIIHWTAGTHKVSATDRKHYHFIIDGDGGMALGNMKPEDNLNTADGSYAAHTRGANTGAIGIAVAAMHGAQERPFKTGNYPITEKQVAALVAQCARLALQYKIPVRRSTILTHAEVERTLGIKQAGKWDIVWLPGMAGVGDAIVIGDTLRRRISQAMAPVAPPWIVVDHKPPVSAPQAPPAIEIPAITFPSWLDRFRAWITGKA